MFGSAWGVWQTHARDDIDDDDDDDNHDHHYHNHLSVSLVGRRVSSAHVPADDYRFIDRGGTIFVTVVALGQSEQGCNGSTVTGIGPVRERGPRDCCLV